MWDTLSHQIKTYKHETFLYVTLHFFFEAKETKFFLEENDQIYFINNFNRLCLR